MFAHCTFCSASLGANQVLEAFPVGRRLAFDSSRGRLWVICRSCERWNLTPLEERWEAVEASERLFRETPLRASTENIGLARHREGLELVRVGAPLRPEFAAWRYGDQFGRRRRRYIANAAVGVGIVGGVALSSAALVSSLAVFNVGIHLFNVGRFAHAALQPGVKLRRHDGDPLILNDRHLRQPRMKPGDPWQLEVSHKEGTDLLTGADAVRALRTLLPKMNRAGGRRAQIQDAVRELEEVGGPEAYFGEAEFRARKLGQGYLPLHALPPHIRLALEMAAHEEVEQEALEGELAWLEAAWKEAEEIAAIADSLALPDRIHLRLRELKSRFGPSGSREG